MTPRFLNLATYRSWKKSAGGLAVIAFMCGSLPLYSATTNWTAGSMAEFNWSTAANWSAGVPGALDDAILLAPIPNPGVLANPHILTLGAGSVANSLTIRDNYILNGGDLATGTIQAGLGMTGIINSQLTGALGLAKTGGGTIRLNNAANNYTGITTISNGSLVIANPAALGTDPSTVVITGSATRGFGGGSLVLDGTAAGITFTRNLSLQGLGPISDRGAALVSAGNNTLSGTVTMGTGLVNTRAISASGTLTLSGTLDVTGTAATTISILGGVNQAGATFYNLTGALTGTGTLDKSGGGTLFLNPSDTSGFSGTVRVSGSAASGQSTVRITSNGVLGTRTASGTGGVLDMNGGILEVLMDSPLVQSGGANANVYGRASSTLFADHGPGGTAINGTVNFGNLSYEDNITLTFASRNGYGMSFTTAPVNGGDNPSTFTNNMTGLLTFTGNFWSNADNAANRTLTIQGTGNTLLTGNLIASAAAFDHNLTKAQAGTLTIASTGATLDGNVNVNGGVLAITDFRSINNNTSANINIATTTTAGTLNIGTTVPSTAAGLITNKVVNLAGTTGGATINANQAGTNPVVFNSAFTATGAGAKTLTLGGTNTADNSVNGAIVDNGVVSLTKTGSGTWVLGGTNTYSGATTISNGILKIRANDVLSTVVNNASAITFNAVNVFAGGTLEFAGQAGVSNVESLGALTPTAGSGTVMLTPGAGGTASLSFASLGTVGAGATVNIVTPSASNTVSLAATTISNNIANAGLFFNGSNFAFVPGAATALRAPIYGDGLGGGGSDTDFVTSAAALTDAMSNEITGSFATGGVNTIDSLRISGAQTLTLGGLLTVRTAGTANATGGILQTGGSGAIDGTGITTGGSGGLILRVDAVTDILTLNAPMTATTTGGFTKTGAGTLVLAGTNLQTGTISINEGTVRLSGTGQLGAASAVTMRQGAVLDLNGVTPATSINAWNSNGTVTNSSATAATLTVGGANGTGTSNGIIQDGTGVVNVTKAGTGGQTWAGASTYTGVTTIGSTGIVSVPILSNITNASGIGAGNAGNNAGSLVFNGASATQVYGGLSYTGTDTISVNRLFTFGGTAADSGARIQANGANNAAIIWNNTAALQFGTADIAQGLVLGGASTGDNRFFPQITDNGTGRVSVFKADAGVWHLSGTSNSYTGNTTLVAGQLGADSGTTLPANSPLVFGGGVLLTSGSFIRNIVAAATPGNANEVAWTTGGGFAARDTKLTVAIGGVGTETALIWASGGFVANAQPLILNSSVALAEVEFRNPIDLNGALRTIQVDDNGNTGADFATISGVISNATGGISKTGTGILMLTAQNTYGGTTEVNAGTIVVKTLGTSGSAGATSVGDQTTANTNTSAIVLGSATTTGGILQYVGPGETSDRKIRLNGTTAGSQIHADGSGPLILTNVAHDTVATGNKTLSLRGTNAAGNMITSQLTNNVAGVLSVTVDGSATWILTNGANSYSGTTLVSAGALGIGNTGALGTGNLDLNNGSIFAHGADRTLSNAVRIINNTTPAVIGEYSLAFSQPVQLLNAANNTGLNNNLASGKTLTFGGATANSLPNNANRTWIVDGSGETIINGDITTTQTGAGGLAITKTGNGTLIFGGSGAGANNYNRNNASTDIDRGTLRLAASEVIGHGLDTQTTPVGYGALILSPELATGDTATFDLNGNNETVNALTATTDGTATIDNTAAGASTLTFGANNATVNFGTGAGTYTITDSGAGALSLVKTGTGIATLGGGTGTTTLTYQGSTTVDGGTLNINSALNGTTALSATGTGIMNVNGALTTPAAITSLTVGGGAAMNLVNGGANGLVSLATLDLGAGAGTAILGLELGASTAGSDRLVMGGAATAANTVQLNIAALPGFGTAATYDLISAVSGLTGGGAAYTLGSMPGGFTYSLNTSDTLVQLGLAALAGGDMFWNGDLSSSWSALAGGNSNFSTDLAGTIDPGGSPGALNTVIFSSTAAPLTGTAISTTLDNNYFINALKFTANPATVNAVTIAPGSSASNSLTIAPALATDGIDVADNAGAVTISAPVVLGANQTWNVVGTGANGSSLTVTGAVSGTADLTKAGAGTATLTANSPAYTGNITISGGSLSIGNGGATGSIGGGNIVDNGTLIYNRTGTFAVPNLITGTGGLTKSASGVMSLDNNSNAFAGPITVTGGAIAFATIGNVGAGPTAMGAPTTALEGTITLAGTLNFTGAASQSTDRLMTFTASSTLAANGTAGATITYNGNITGAATSLTLDGTGTGFFNGGITMTGTANDINKNGTGTWTLGGTSTIADDINVNAGILNINATQIITDDIVVTNPGAILNLNVANVHQGDDLFVRNGGVVNLGINGALGTAAPGMDALNIAENAAAANAAVFDLRGFTSTVGATTVGFENSAVGQIVDSVGGGVLTAASYTVRNGFASAILAGAGGVTKNGAGVFTLSGSNTFTGASTVTEGELILDYTGNNNNKISATAGLTLGGASGDLQGRITFNSNASNPSTQAFTTLTLNAGAHDFVPVSNGGQAMNVNFTTITRNAGGTVNFVLPAVGNITTTHALTNGILGGFATVNNGTAFATKDGSNNITAFTSHAAKDNVSTWLTADNVIDTTGFTGATAIDCAAVNSITFTQPGSTVNVGQSLGIVTGGIMVSSTATNARILGGRLASGINDIVVHQNSASDIEIGSSMRGAIGVTKNGNGALLLSGTSTATGAVNINEGIIKVSGGNAIGNNAQVNIKEAAGAGLTLLASETIGNLAGGGALGGDIDLGANTLTVNQASALAFGGELSGSGTLVKQGTANLQLAFSSSTAFTGSILVNQGLLFASTSGISNLPAVNSITVNPGGSFMVDNNGATAIPDRVNNGAIVTLNGLGNGAFFGIQMRGDQDVSGTEVLGSLFLAGGGSAIAVNQNGGTDRTSNLTFGSITRQNNATIFLDGRNLAVTTGNNRGRIFFTTAPALVGGTGVAGATTPATNIPILRYAVTLLNTASVAIGDVPNTFANYNTTTGVTPLNIATEYRLDAAGYAASTDATDNLRFTTGATGLATQAFNAVVFDSSAASMAVSGGAGNVLTVGSGAMLFTSTVLANTTTVDTYGGLTPGAASSNEWIITVANTTANINSVLNNGAGATTLTKSGSGALVLGADNLYTGGTVINQGFVQADTLARLGPSGALTFAGGGLRFGGVFDPSTRGIALNLGSGTFDTNGNDIVFANSAGSGAGGLTKAGTGNLTLNAAATYTGTTAINAGTLTVGANNATGIGGDVNVGAGATLALGANSITAGLVTTSGASPLITGSGTITANTGVFLNHTGDTTIDAIIAGSGGLLKAQANVVTLTGASTYSGATEIQAGTLSINSIGNVGGGASALGNPTTVDNGTIRMGLTTGATTLTYTGGGHTSDRVIAMTGTTGSVTIDADGTGTLVLTSGVHMQTGGNKTLILRGTSAAAIDNQIAMIDQCDLGVLTLNKTDASTWLLTGDNQYTGATQIDDGTLKIGLNDALPDTTAVRLGTGTTVGILDLNGFNQTIGSLTSNTNSTTATNQIIVDGGNTLTINGAVTLGVNADVSTTLVTATGGGAIVVNSGGANFQVGGATGGTNENTATVDFTGLSSFTASLGTGTFRIGDANTSSGTAAPAAMRLPATSTITAANIRVGDSSGFANNHTLTLGSGVNTLNGDTLNVGSAGAGIRSSGTVNFDAGDATGSVIIRGSAGGATPVANFNMVNTTGSTTANMDSTVNLAGHTADIIATNMVMASRTASSGGTTSTFTFDQGTLQIGALTMASRTGAGTGGAAATMNLGDSAAPGSPTTTIGPVTMAVNTSAGGAVTADLNVTGGAVNIGPINMANAGTSRTVTSTIDLTGGEMILAGSITRTGGAGTENATLTVNGGALDMNAANIGTGSAPITLVAASGIIRDLGELNGGGAFSKTTAGTLTLEGVNTHTGDTTVTAGTLVVHNTGGSGTGSGAVTVNASTFLAGNGSIAPAAGKNILLDGETIIGVPASIVAEDLAMTITGASTLSFNSTVRLDIFANANTGTLNPLTANDLMDVSAPDWASIAFGAGSTLKVDTLLATAAWMHGDAWKIFDWAGIAGTPPTVGSGGFATLDLPALTGGQTWDTTQIYTSGVISINVIPEPGRAMLMLFGLLAAVFRRRRAFSAPA